MRERLLGRGADPFVQDLALAIAVAVVGLFGVAVAPEVDERLDWRWQVSYALIALIAVALRRRHTWVAVAIISVHTLGPVFTPAVSTGLELPVLTYTVATYLPLRRAITATTLMWAPALTLWVTLRRTQDAAVQLEPAYFLAFNALVALVCFLVGRTVATRRAYVEALEDRARTAETSQRALTDKAVAEERRRIARELHDVVAHHVSVMGVLATGSRRMLARDPAAADEALATIEETGRTALREMRRLLSVLRTEAEPAGELAPQPDMAGVEGLVEQVRDAGLAATLKVEGVPGPLDSGISLTVYRIVQEALTNALKHAGAATVEVRLQFRPQELIVEVCDTGRGPQLGAVAIGHGLLGMRERVMLYGGTLRTGPRPGGGYRVYAKIPLDVSERQLAS